MIALMGIYYSKLWEVVRSNEFANLTVECAQTTAEPILRPEVRQRSRDTLSSRVKLKGQTAAEKRRTVYMHSISHSAACREKAQKTMKDRI